MSIHKSSKGGKKNSSISRRNQGSSRQAARRPGKSTAAEESWFYGDHAVFAALANPQRKLKRLLITKAKISGLDSDRRNLIEANGQFEIVDKDTISAALLDNAVHQGVAALPLPLADLTIDDLLGMDAQASETVAVLDQVTDPHNVGAILRSAAAFNIKAVIVPDRHSPPITGVLARSASGAVETVPIIRVGNLSRALDQLADKGFWRIGLDGYAETLLETVSSDLKKIAIVLGSEGKGLRHLTSQKCDLLAKLPISPGIESLNVSNAAAITFYELARSR
ncbi:23S rRNA (guanosine(2251)-2'-O)-methyltransferase RlmB [Sneathiella marina]|uniref:23S rRNA (Guanosine(2251)-2'-O)-methyltransferase RlmB n=1 Tax=Sneathiella marina TaxID=2950108 RepID=A0ABY4W6J9_9PROT|nr:23S rRNA (guanosine(2251)-2'-O)-methyltransferase RlmB [Sneathiella marina]USG60281.1 23S rRNA (guanosine(2251)-2'-O)-methyltransferase RlmB [Sneathiella marina]